MEEATEKQMALIRKLGVEYNPEKFISKEEAAEVIDTALKARQPKFQKTINSPVLEKSYPKTTREYGVWAKEKSTKTMYVSYSKDIFIALMDRMIKVEPKSKDLIQPELIMEKAIELVQKARDAF